MFDIKAIRDDPQAFDAGMARRGVEPQAAALLVLDATRREAIAETQALQTERNAKSKEIGAAKGRGEGRQRDHRRGWRAQGPHAGRRGARA